MKKDEWCNKCGLLPQQPVKPCQQRCFCKPQKRLCKPKDCCPKLEIFVVPAMLGDDLAGKYKATQGLFKNMVVSYEANGAKYIYDTNGAYIKL